METNPHVAKFHVWVGTATTQLQLIGAIMSNIMFCKCETKVKCISLLSEEVYLQDKLFLWSLVL